MVNAGDRVLKVAAAQLGPIHLADDRASVVERMIALMREAYGAGCRLVVFPELALTTFFPRYLIEDHKALLAYFERAMPGPDTRPLFETAAELGIGFYLGYAELAEEDGEERRYNTAILVDPSGKVVGKYRKVHLPGNDEVRPDHTVQHLEKRYFHVGNLGFPVSRFMGGVVGMCICNDRRWPETYRVMGLQGAEMILIGYNTTAVNNYIDEEAHLRMFHHRLVVQSGAYQNGTWVAAAAKAGREDGFSLIGGTCIVAPSGEIVAEAFTRDDELVTATCDLAFCDRIKSTVFNFARHRRVEHYGLITERTGAVPPPPETESAAE